MMASVNDKPNYDEIILANLGLIRRIGVRQYVRTDELDDFVQEVIFRIYSQREKFPDIRLFPQWMGGIARNTALEWNRRRFPDLMAEPEGMEGDLSFFRPEERGDWELLMAALDSLDPVDRDLLYSYYINETGYTELQARYGLSYSATGLRLHRARNQVRETVTAMRNALSGPRARGGLSAAVVNGKVYAVGGRFLGARSPSFGTVEEYDPAKNLWLGRSYMPTPRGFSGACALNGKIYVIGGYGTGQPARADVEVYDPETDCWERCADMPTPRHSMAAGVVGGKIYVAGGFGGHLQDPIVAVEVYDPETDTWTKRDDMPRPRARMAAGVVNDRIYLCGGWVPPPLQSRALSLTDEYDPVSDRWTSKAEMPTPREGAAAVVINDRIYVLGGWMDDTSVTTQPIVPTVEEYDPATDKWVRKADMPNVSTYHAAGAVNGKIYLVGGTEQPSQKYFTSHDAYRTEHATAKQPTKRVRPRSAKNRNKEDER